MSAVLQVPSGAFSSTDSRQPVNLRQVLTTKLLRMGGRALAEAINKDESTASRILNGERGCTIAEFCILLELVELKLVQKDKLCIAADELRMLRRVYNNVSARELVWDDPE